MGDKCELLGKGKIRFCFDCEAYPCKMLKSLDKRYGTKYHMSMIENLNYIKVNKVNGVEKFLELEEINRSMTRVRWTTYAQNDTDWMTN